VGLVTKDLHEELQKNTEVTVAVAVIRALTRVIERSTATTVMGLEKDLHSATVELKESYPTVISVSAASELFLRFVTRTSALDLSDFHALKQHLIDRGNQFAQISSAAKAKIAELGERFLHGGCTVMVLGYSSVMLNLLETAVSKGKFFTVIVAESKPGKEGLRMYKALERAKIQVSMILDAQVRPIRPRQPRGQNEVMGEWEQGGRDGGEMSLTFPTIKIQDRRLDYLTESFRFVRSPLTRSRTSWRRSTWC